MHIILGFFTIVGTLIFWAIRLSANRRNIGDAANMVHGAAIQVKNMPRRRKFSKAYHKRGFDLIENPMEAATVLMIMIARAGESRRLDEDARVVIEAQLSANMNLSNDDADSLIRQMDSLTYDIVLPETAIKPMSKVLQTSVTKETAVDLANMLAQVASADSAPSSNQKEFLRSFREGFDLN